MNKYDLHIHSSYSSDGELEISEILEKVVNARLDVFSITDHNSVRGVPEAMLMAGQKGCCCVPGIEIDCHFNGVDLHLLGYHFLWQSEDFQNLEKEVEGKAKEAFSEMIFNLHKLGIEVEASEVLDRAGGKIPTGELIAEVLLSDKKYGIPALSPYMPGGERSDMPYINFYLDFFAQGKPAYVKIDYMPYSQAVELIRDHGGIPIVAHPGLNFKGKEEMVEKLLEKGACGLEVFNNYHEYTQVDYFAGLVRREQVLMTCGSDFHGKTKPLIEVGKFRFDERFTKELDDSLYQLKEKV